LPDLALLEQMIEEATQAMKKAETAAEKRKAKERREDLTRLKRVEQVYVGATLWLRTLFFNLTPLQGAILPVLSGWVLILLKLLLATVSASTNMQAPQSSTSSVFPQNAISRRFSFSFKFRNAFFLMPHYYSSRPPPFCTPYVR
jgi:hypothetical protein